ncbi:UNKNOWN [Stylonychia lemnae]|uniref:Uncharacterized protein n=1 Tax=Stylonychia lemnae TaxID=5949 RepID=A0A077ZYL1_STYLE|nr:UNKNOWN [Stylonychia lemnae]|eukprot:CDW75031.1 UNKNOWN [Stylonychia lemnae]
MTIADRNLRDKSAANYLETIRENEKPIFVMKEGRSNQKQQKNIQRIGSQESIISSSGIDRLNYQSSESQLDIIGNIIISPHKRIINNQKHINIDEQTQSSTIASRNLVQINENFSEKQSHLSITEDKSSLSRALQRRENLSQLYQETIPDEQQMNINQYINDGIANRKRPKKRGPLIAQNQLFPPLDRSTKNQSETRLLKLPDIKGTSRQGNVADDVAFNLMPIHSQNNQQAVNYIYQPTPEEKKEQVRSRLEMLYKVRIPRQKIQQKNWENQSINSSGIYTKQQVQPQIPVKKKLVLNQQNIGMGIKQGGSNIANSIIYQPNGLSNSSVGGASLTPGSLVVENSGLPAQRPGWWG